MYCAVLSHSVVSDFDPMDYSPPGLSSMRFSKQECWSGLPCPAPGDHPNPGIKTRSPTSQVHSLPAEPLGKPKTLEWVAYPFFRGSS